MQVVQNAAVSETDYGPAVNGTADPTGSAPSPLRCEPRVFPDPIHNRAFDV